MSKNTLAMIEAECPDREHLPPELLLDHTHPDNDQYFDNLNAIRRQLVSQQARMKPKHAEAVKLSLSGKLSTREIGERLNITANTVRNAINSTDGKQLRAILIHMQHAVDGVNVNHRKHVLWRIALNNEAERPNVSVTAIQEINKMTNAYQAPESTGVNIIINNIPRGGLDRLPETYESTAHIEEADTGE